RNFNGRGQVQLLVQVHKNTGAVQKGMVRVDETGAYRHLKCVYTVLYGDISRSLGIYTPRILTDFPGIQSLFPGLGLETLHILWKLPNQVGTGRPDRHFKIHVLPFESRNREDDIHVMSLGLFKRQCIRKAQLICPHRKTRQHETKDNQTPAKNSCLKTHDSILKIIANKTKPD